MHDATLLENSSAKCKLCFSSSRDDVMFGEKFQINNLVVHYYCVLLSHRTPQKGADEEGVRGFLYEDIQDEIMRCKSIMCVYCGKTGAPMQCHKCKIKFHLPCGLAQKSLSQFNSDFRSYCSAHRPRQVIPQKVAEDALRNPPTCIVCLEIVDADDPYDSLWAPCCQKNWYHRECLQKLALSQASLFKCAVCSNLTKFKKWMVKFGIFIPERDAAWELEPHAFQTLTERHSRCDMEHCDCPYGRTADREGSRWEIVLCQTCGSQGTHVRCSSLKFSSVDWECKDCAMVPGLSKSLGQSESRSSGFDESAFRHTPSPSPTVTASPRKCKRSKHSRWARGGYVRRKNKSNSRSKQSKEEDVASTSTKSPTRFTPTYSDSEEADENYQSIRPKCESSSEELAVLSDSASNSGSQLLAAEQLKQEMKTNFWDRLCVRKQTPESDSSDVEVIEVEDSQPECPSSPIDVETIDEPEEKMAATDKTEKTAGTDRTEKITNLPVDNEGQPVKFIVIGGKLFEIGAGEGETMTLRSMGGVMQTDLVNPEISKKVGDIKPELTQNISKNIDADVKTNLIVPKKSSKNMGTAIQNDSIASSFPRNIPPKDSKTDPGEFEVVASRFPDHPNWLLCAGGQTTQTEYPATAPPMISSPNTHMNRSAHPSSTPQAVSKKVFPPNVPPLSSKNRPPDNTSCWIVDSPEATVLTHSERPSREFASDESPQHPYPLDLSSPSRLPNLPAPSAPPASVGTKGQCDNASQTQDSALGIISFVTSLKDYETRIGQKCSNSRLNSHDPSSPYISPNHSEGVGQAATRLEHQKECSIICDVGVSSNRKRSNLISEEPVSYYRKSSDCRAAEHNGPPSKQYRETTDASCQPEQFQNVTTTLKLHNVETIDLCLPQSDDLEESSKVEKKKSKKKKKKKKKRKMDDDVCFIEELTPEKAPKRSTDVAVVTDEESFDIVEID